MPRKKNDHRDLAWVSQEQITSALPSLPYSTGLLVQARKEARQTGDHCSKTVGTGKGHLN